LIEAVTRTLAILNMILYCGVTLILPIVLMRYFKLGWANLLLLPVLVALPITLVITFSGPLFFLEGGWFNVYFQYALLVENVHSILIAVTTIYLVQFLHTRRPGIRIVERLMRQGVTVRPERMRLAAALFFGLFLISFVLLAQPTYGVINWILNPRTGYQYYRTGAGQWYAFCLLFLSVSVVLATTYARSAYTAIAVMPIYMAGVYLLGAKGFIILFVAYLIVILAIRQFRYFKPFALVVVAAGALLIASNFVSALGGYGIDEISQYSDYFVNAAKYYEAFLNGSLPLFHGEVFLSSFWSLVPRALYPGKPYVYGVIKVIDAFYPGQAEQTSTPAFATVDYFADFGWFGVLLSGIFSPANFMNALLYAMVLPRISTFNLRNRIPHRMLMLFAYILTVAPAFLVYFTFPMNIVISILVIKLIDVSNRMRLSHAVFEPGGRSLDRIEQ